MKSFDDGAIDRVLDGLRTAEPHAGLEQRVRLGLAAKQAESHEMRSWMAPLWRRGGVWPGVAGVVAVALVITGVGLHPFGRHQNTSPKPGSTASSSAPALNPAEKPPNVASSDEDRKPRPTMHPATFRLAAQARRDSASQAASAKVSSSPLLSFPAPEAPLTEQEKLLLRIARHPDPTDLALLNPEKREELAAVNAADFKQFFKPSPLQEKIDELQAAELPPQK